MPYTTLISAEQLDALQRSGQPLMIFDCSYNLADAAAGQQQFAQAHIPGACHADLHVHLSSHAPQRAASQGRHPLPLREDFAATLRQWGFANSMQAVVYDRNGCNFCGRLWWMLKWLGHDAVAILDWGLQAWQAAGYALETGAGAWANNAAASDFAIQPPLVDMVSTEEVQQSLANASMLLIDARGAARYRGDTEPMDPIAGHIPGAINRPFADNLTADGRFKSAPILQAELAALLPPQALQTPTSAATRPPQTVVYCGSGVSAIPTLLALELAGWPRPTLYAGSWSAWSNTPGLPVERG